MLESINSTKRIRNYKQNRIKLKSLNYSVIFDGLIRGQYSKYFVKRIRIINNSNPKWNIENNDSQNSRIIVITHPALVEFINPVLLSYQERNTK